MARDPRYDVLFEPVRIDPVTAKNRFYRVPHSCSALGDCNNRATIATAVYDGHRAARELDAAPAVPDMSFRRERVSLSLSV